MQDSVRKSPFERRSGVDRRKSTLPILSKYWLTGRRTTPRRAEDRKRAHFMDRHGPKTFAAILSIVMLSVLDAMFTLDLIDRGAVELNPVMAYYLGHGPLIFFGVKFMLTWATIMLIFLNKDVYLFKTRLQMKILFLVFIIPLVATVQWELYLMFSITAK